MQQVDWEAFASGGVCQAVIDPRCAWVPPYSRTLGTDAIAWWKANGGHLFEWQELVVEGLLALDEADKFVASDDGLDVSRQNGKGVILQVVEGFVAFEYGAGHGYDVVMHTAHEFPTSLEHQMRLEAFIQDSPALHARVKDRGGYVHANGQESIRLKDGTRIVFRARTKGGGRGYSGDLLVWDEAMVIPDVVVGAQKPMLRASGGCFGHKTIYAGSAVDQEVHQHGITFARIREKGWAQSPRVSWHEWSAPFDHPSQLDDTLLHDRELWLQANPSMAEGLIAPETMADEIEVMPVRTAAVELFGVGDWPRTDGLEDTVIDIVTWDALAVDATVSTLQEPYCGAFDVSPERNGSISVAGRNLEGQFQGEIHEHRLGTGWMVDRIVQMDERGLFECWVCDATGPASSLIQPLRDAGLRVETVNATEHGQAYGRFLDMVADGQLVHLGSEEMRDAIRGAKPRPIGDGSYAWGRKHSTVNISPLVAMTLALGAASGIGAGLQVF